MGSSYFYEQSIIFLNWRFSHVIVGTWKGYDDFIIWQENNDGNGIIVLHFQMLVQFVWKKTLQFWNDWNMNYLLKRNLIKIQWESAFQRELRKDSYGVGYWGGGGGREFYVTITFLALFGH